MTSLCDLNVVIEGVISNQTMEMTVPSLDIFVHGMTYADWNTVPSVIGGDIDTWNEVVAIIGGSFNPWNITAVVDGGEMGWYEPDLFDRIKMSVSSLNIKEIINGNTD